MTKRKQEKLMKLTHKETHFKHRKEAMIKLGNAYNLFCVSFNVNGYYLDLKNELKIKKYLKKIGELL